SFLSFLRSLNSDFIVHLVNKLYDKSNFMIKRIKSLTNFINPVYFLAPTMLFFSACGGDKNKGKTTDESIMDYPVIVIKHQATTLNSNYPATIEGQQNIEIRPKVEGFIERIYVDEGATV